MAKTGVVGVGLFRGVRDTGEPYDDASENLLQDLSNGYLPDPEAGSGAYARPGFTTTNSMTVTASGNGQGVYAHRALDGTVYNFLAAGGKIWRQPNDLTLPPVDVTPTNIIVATGKFITFTSLAGELIVNDNVNKPWRGTSLGSTPITATVIEQRTPTVDLSRGSNDVRLANAAFTYTLRAGGSIGTQATFAANTTGTAIGALGQIAAGTWGAILVELNSSAALVFTAAFNAGAGYASSALALAALPARTATRWYVGYVLVQADPGAVWIAGTDAFAGGATGNQAQTTTYGAGEGAAWSAFGQPVIYTGAVFFILNQLNAAYARTTITWSEPNLPGEGYQQSGYDDAWTLTQTGSDPLYALAATNDALYYSRQLSWGAIAGAPGVNFQGTASHDVVSGNVGCVAYMTVKVFRNMVYFADQSGRPYRFTVGGSPEPIWLQTRANFDVATTISPTLIGGLAFATIEPNLNLILFAIWPAFAFAQGYYQTRLYAFDAVTGIYVGQWFINTGGGGEAALDIAGIGYDDVGNARLLLLGDPDTGTACPVYYLGLQNAATWTDNANVPVIQAKTGWLGYDGKTTYRATQARVMQQSTTQSVTLTASSVASGTTTSTRTPKAVHTFTARSVFPLNAAVGRGVQLTASPTTATVQWKCYRIEVDLDGDGTANVEDC